MTERKAALGELETLVLLAILRMKDGAAAADVRREVGERGGRELSRGATYSTLYRLEKKGFVRGIEAPEGEGTARHRFALTDEGLTVLRTAQRNLARMRAGLEALLDDA